MPKAPYASAAWRKIRLEVLERDGWRCRVRLPGCTDIATCVDHIMPIVQGGRWLDPLNLRASCTHCNSARVHMTDVADPQPLPRREW